MCISTTEAIFSPLSPCQSGLVNNKLDILISYLHLARWSNEKEFSLSCLPFAFLLIMSPGSGVAVTSLRFTLAMLSLLSPLKSRRRGNKALVYYVNVNWLLTQVLSPYEVRTGNIFYWQQMRGKNMVTPDCAYTGNYTVVDVLDHMILFSISIKRPSIFKGFTGVLDCLENKVMMLWMFGYRESLCRSLEMLVHASLFFSSADPKVSSAELMVLLICPSSSSVVCPSTFALNRYSSYSSYSIILNFLLEKLGI